MSEPMDGPGCGGHPGLAAELRAIAITALDRLQPALERIRTDAAATPAGCAACPICALIAALRGERPELAIRLAEQASELLAVLRSALDEGAGATPGGTTASEPAGPTRRSVQHIPVDRT